MTKSVQLKLSKVKYSRDSIGNDIRIKIEVLGKFLLVDKRIKADATIEINQEVGRFETEQKSLESLPAFLKVKPEYGDGKREYFIPVEGAYRNRLVSAKLQDDGSSNLISSVQHEPMAHASYSISKRILIVNGKAYTTVDYKNAPWKKGLYDIEIPDYPHSIGARYEKEALRAKTWFRVGHNEDRYILAVYLSAISRSSKENAGQKSIMH